MSTIYLRFPALLESLQVLQGRVKKVKVKRFSLDELLRGIISSVTSGNGTRAR